MKRNVIIAAMVSTVFVGCSDSTPDGVAQKFAMSLSEAKLEDAKQYTSRGALESFNYVSKLCTREEKDNLVDQSMKVVYKMSKIKYKKKSKKKEPVLDENGLMPLESPFNERWVELNKKWNKTFDSIRGTTSDKEKIEEKLKNAFLELTKERVESFGIKLNEDKREEILNIVSEYTRRNGLDTSMFGLAAMKKVAGKFLAKKIQQPDEKCIDSISEFGYINNINVIELKKPSEDIANVKLEFIKDSGESKKVKMKLEYINKEWKVVSSVF